MKKYIYVIFEYHTKISVYKQPSKLPDGEGFFPAFTSLKRAKKFVGKGNSVIHKMIKTKK